MILGTESGRHPLKNRLLKDKYTDFWTRSSLLGKKEFFDFALGLVDARLAGFDI